MATALTPIAWQSLGSATSSVTFSSIPQTYRDLRLVVTGIGSATTLIVSVINADAGANYNWILQYGDAVSPSSSSATSNSGNTFLTGSGYFGTQSVMTVDYLDYSATDKHKNYLVRSNTAANMVGSLAGRWASTVAITSFTVQMNSGTFSAGTTFALYGIAA